MANDRVNYRPGKTYPYVDIFYYISKKAEKNGKKTLYLTPRCPQQPVILARVTVLAALLPPSAAREKATVTKTASAPEVSSVAQTTAGNGIQLLTRILTAVSNLVSTTIYFLAI